MPVVAPPHLVRRAAIGPLHVENDRLTVVLTYVVTSHHDLVSDGCLHVYAPPRAVHHQHRDPRYATLRLSGQGLSPLTSPAYGRVRWAREGAEDEVTFSPGVTNAYGVTLSACIRR